MKQRQESDLDAFEMWSEDDTDIEIFLDRFEREERKQRARASRREIERRRERQQLLRDLDAGYDD